MLILLAIPARRVRWLVAGAFGVVVVVATVVAALDLGFEATVDRAFSLVDDGPAIVDAFGVVGDATGTVNAFRHRGRPRRAARRRGVRPRPRGDARGTGHGAIRSRRTDRGRDRDGDVDRGRARWASHSCRASRSRPPMRPAALATTSTQTAQSIRDQQAFASAVRSGSPSATCPRDQLLSALKGKDVVVAFIESYGKVAVQDSTFSPGVDRVLQAGDAQLTADGYSAQSAFLTSPTFGGVSWLAHSTLQSGVWIDSQQNYDRLIAGDRLTITRAFKDAGWHTVSVVPSNKEPWALGQQFYGYDTHDELAEHGIPGAGVQLRAHPRPVHLAALLRRGAHGPARAGHGRDRLRVVSHAVDSAAPPRAVADARRRLDLRPPARAGAGAGRRLA